MSMNGIVMGKADIILTVSGSKQRSYHCNTALYKGFILAVSEKRHEHF